MFFGHSERPPIIFVSARQHSAPSERKGSNASFLAQQVGELGDIRGNAPSFVLRQQLRR